jgi:peptide deformylase
MAVRRILQLGDPLLRVVSRRATNQQEIDDTMADMRDTLYDFRRRHGFGRGISAIQIGVPLRLIFMVMNGKEWALENPTWVERSVEKFTMWDDCFSFPELMVRLERSKRIQVSYQSFEGQQVLYAADDFAELVQHEMDHLDGVLAVDYARGKDGLMTRTEWLRQKALATSPTQE